jgi:hypothetical protein
MRGQNLQQKKLFMLSEQVLGDEDADEMAIFRPLWRKNYNGNIF